MALLSAKMKAVDVELLVLEAAFTDNITDNHKCNNKKLDYSYTFYRARASFVPTTNLILDGASLADILP